MPDDAAPSLHQWAGGEVAIRRLIDRFYDRVEHDDLLSPFFPGGVHEEHRAHVAAWWSEVLGGPARYTEQLGGYESMLAHHRGLAITPEQRFRFASLLSLAADDADLPADPEFRSALVTYIEWGTRLAMHNSQPGAEVVERAPVPRWGLGRGAPVRARLIDEGCGASSGLDDADDDRLGHFVPSHRNGGRTSWPATPTQPIPSPTRAEAWWGS